MNDDKNEIKLVISGNPRSKKNNMRPARRKNGTFCLIQSQNYLDFADLARPQLTAQFEGKKTIDYACNVKLIYYRADKRRTDLVNLQNATLDLLVNANVLSDDNYKIVQSTDGSRVYYDKNNPRTEIYITPVQEGE